jgi:hypothetical protein
LGGGELPGMEWAGELHGGLLRGEGRRAVFPSVGW